MSKTEQAENRRGYESNWTITFDVQTDEDDEKTTTTMSISARAFTAAQARRKILAAVRQRQEGQTTMKGSPDFHKDDKFHGPDFSGKFECVYPTFQEMIENAFLTRERIYDVVLRVV
jgi:hypothetical protein